MVHRKQVDHGQFSVLDETTAKLPRSGGQGKERRVEGNLLLHLVFSDDVNDSNMQCSQFFFMHLLFVWCHPSDAVSFIRTFLSVLL